MKEINPTSFPPAMKAFGGFGALTLPSWAPWLGVGGFIWAGMAKKIPMWAAAVGAFATWYFLLGSTTSQVITGTAYMITPDGTQASLPANSTTLVTTMGGGQQLVNQGVAYPVLSISANADGSTTYFVDNPAANLATS